MAVQDTLERDEAYAAPQDAPGPDVGKAGSTGAKAGAAAAGSAPPLPTASVTRRIPESAKRWGIRGVAILVAIAIWHALTTFDFNYIMNFENVPEPFVVAANFFDHVQTSEFFIHILVSIKRILMGYSFAVVLGILIGLLMGRSKLAEDFFIPYIEVLRPIPAVAWIPLAILMWPTEESSIIYITFLGAFFPIVINTIHGAEQTPEVLVRAAQSLGASRIEIFWHVVIPAALPSIAAGLSIGMGVSWFSLLAGEIISGQYGIGYFTWNAYSLIEYPNIVVGMLVIGGLGTLSTYLVKLATLPLLRWQKAERGR
ncbi:MAG: ABC transporter permease [Pseudomonadota bacterium]